ncbi:MAG: adenylate/guanylate cyclase domain-containing protein [Polaromonas sp.]
MNRSTKVLLVMDVVESVRLMEQDEDDFVRRWQQLVQHAEQILPLHGGRIVKSLGDGLMLEFANAQGCTRAAFAMQHLSKLANSSYAPQQQLHLRMGGHLASFVTDQHDIYGTDVNLTARFCTLAGPGEIVVTDDLRDCLTAELDADIEDLGECHLKHVENTVRAYRIGPAGHAPVIAASTPENTDFRPTIAVIPFEARSNEPEHFVIGELIADGIIAQLSRSPDIRVISRLSTSSFRGRTSSMPEVSARLDATFTLSGSYVASSGKLVVMAELADARRDEVIWADRLSGDVGELLQVESELLSTLTARASRALIDTEVKHSLVQPMPRLDSNALMLGGITLMHRSSINEFNRGRTALESLAERHPRVAAPRAWLAKWYTLRVLRGLSDSPDEDTSMGLEQTRRALDISPNHALALAIEGYVRCQLRGEAEVSRQLLAHAIAIDPNEPMAWLYQSVWSTMWGGSSASVKEAENATSLSPLDPLKYFFDLILAGSYLSTMQHENAIALASRALRANKGHLPALRLLLCAQWECGRATDAQSTLREITQIAPQFSLESYTSMGSSGSALRQRMISVLKQIDSPSE